MNMELIKLKNLVDIYLGVTHTPEYTTTGVPFLSVKDISGGSIVFNNCKYISELEYDSLPNGAKPKEGDLLFCRVGTIGKPILIPKGTPKFGSFVSLGFLRNKDSEKCELNYLKYWMNSENFYTQVKSNVKGASQINLNTGWLSKFDVPLLPLNEQKEIVEKFDKIQNIINLRKQQLQQLDDLVKARFVEMFGDPVENPYGWEQTTLKNVAIGKLSYGSGASACEYDGNIRYVRITDIDSSGRLNDDVVSPSVIEEKYILNDGDILFARSGATVGKSYRYRECDGKCLYAGYLIRLVPNTELVLPDYVFYYTKTSYYERFIASNMKVVAQPNINAQQYGDLTICIPPMKLQKVFLSFIEQTDKSKFVCLSSMAIYNKLFHNHNFTGVIL